jgi:hypothetical protein
VRRVHHHSTRALAALICLLGLAMVVSTIVRGGGPLSVGVIMGLVFVAFGAARLYLSGILRDER